MGEMAEIAEIHVAFALGLMEEIVWNAKAEMQTWGEAEGSSCEGYVRFVVQTCLCLATSTSEGRETERDCE